MPEDIDQSERRIVLVAYGFGWAAAWWTVVAVIAAVTRGQVAHQPIQTRTA